jgi:hypothetical protein
MQAKQQGFPVHSPGLTTSKTGGGGGSHTWRGEGSGAAHHTLRQIILLLTARVHVTKTATYSMSEVTMLSLRSTTLHVKEPNFVMECLTFLFRILEVPGSNLGTDTGYPDWGFSWCPSVSRGEFCDSTSKLDRDRFLPNPLQFNTYKLFIRRHIVWAD